MEPECQQDTFFKDTRCHPLVADSTEIDRFELRELIELILGYEFSGIDVPVSPDIKIGPLDIEVEPLSCCFQHLLSLGQDLRADPVSTYRCDFVHTGASFN